jgi:alkanesulfonate monooxygenase SsuD/methylene tetrahydromethanopterin reductase-like flavin-dependent oxidoreductase (luciferase family)
LINRSVQEVCIVKFSTGSAGYEPLKRILEMAKTAEKTGFHGFWVQDNVSSMHALVLAERN